MYYSGAGNTEYITNKFEDVINRRGNEVNVERITLNNHNALNSEFDILGIGFPIHFRSTPELVSNTLRQINGQNRSIFFYCTKGLYSGNAMRDIILLAKEQKFVPQGYIEFYMPGIDALILYAKKHSISERMLKAMHTRNITGKIERFADCIQKEAIHLSRDNLVTSGLPGLIQTMPGSPDVTRLSRLRWIAQKDKEIIFPRKKWYTVFDESIIKKLEIRTNNAFKDYISQFCSIKEKCVGCGKCVRDCPRNNIESVNTEIIFGHNCDTCFRCIHACPAEAIQIGDKTINTVRYNPFKDVF